MCVFSKIKLEVLLTSIENKNNMKSSFLKLHLSVIIAGFTGVFGKLISLHQLPMVFWRVALAAVLLGAILMITHKLSKMKFVDILRFCGVGVLLALHWVFFFGSIKESNISVGVVCYSLVGVFSALLEPPISRKPFSTKDLLFSLITVGGIVLIFNFDTQFRFGIILGIISSGFASLFTITNKMVVERTGSTPSNALFHEMWGGAIVLSAIALFAHGQDPAMALMPSQTDFLWLLVLASVCTIWLQILQIQVLKKLSAFTVNLAYNLEPIYSIVIAVVLFNEAREMTPSFIIGLALILLSVALQTISVAWSSRKEATSPA